MHRRVRAATVAATLLIAACATGKTPPPVSPPITGPSGPDTGAPTPEPVTITCPSSGTTLNVAVGPLVRLDATTTAMPLAASAETVVWLDDWNAGYGTDPTARGPRLVDLDQGEIYESIGARRDRLEVRPEAPVETVTYFGSATGTSYVVLVPMCGYALDVPVVDATPELRHRLRADDVALDRRIGKPVPAETLKTAADDSVEARTTKKSIVMTLAADVFFAFGSADLSQAAVAKLSEIGRKLSALGGGSLSIVGYTDDVGTDAYNLDLSRRRASAVSRALTPASAGWRLSVDGRGKKEPRASGTSAAARAANRRVELTVTPTTVPSTATDAAEGTTPKPKGPTADGHAGVELEDPRGSMGIRLASVTRKGRFLLGLVEVTGGPKGTWGGPGQYLSPRRLSENARGEGEGQWYSTTGLTLLLGAQRLHPVDYLSPATKSHRPLTELDASEHLDADEKAVLVAVWPDPGGKTVVLDQMDEAHAGLGFPFRLTDIPVK